MTSSELKLKAKERLMGKKKNAAVAVLVLMLILLAIDMVFSAAFPGKTETKSIGDIRYTVTQSNPIASIVSLAVSVFLFLGIYSYFMKIARGEEPELKELFSKGNIVVKALVTTIIVGFVTALGYIALIIPGIIISFMYSMVEFIYIDNPEVGIIEVMKKSREMMKGHKWQYFCLMLSFLGWIILAVFTLGILLFWLTPYMGVTVALFYDSIRGEGSTEVTEVEEVNE